MTFMTKKQEKLCLLTFFFFQGKAGLVRRLNGLQGLAANGKLPASVEHARTNAHNRARWNWAPIGS